MAALTGKRGMYTQQGELGQGMIEFYFFMPSQFVMAVLTFLALLAFMGIALTVAAVAVRGHLLIQFAAVTILASDFFVFSFKGKIRFVMVKLGFFETAFSMAVIALHTVSTAVDVIEFMATDAACFQVFLVNIFTLVAVAAIKLGVRKAQFELGVFVVVENQFKPVDR